MQKTSLSFHQKKIGIWGFGTVGKSALIYFSGLNISCTVLDKRALTEEEHGLLQKHHATYLSEQDIENFFSITDIIFASPGIDINPFKHRSHFICELDLFTTAWHKPLIAVTGTIGKTSTTTLLANILQKQMHIAVGGNIGTPMLQFLEKQASYDYALLELSSWQLEHAQQLKPDIAVWTNFYPNHLDRHHTTEAYFHAKLPILRDQTASQIAVLPLSLRSQITPFNRSSQKIWFTDTTLTSHQEFEANESILYIENDLVMIKNNHTKRALIEINMLPNFTYLQNMLSTIAVLYTLNLPVELLMQSNLSIEHRLEKISACSDIIFYNDSKATVPDATLAALTQFKYRQVTLLLGGLSKGVDRSYLIQSLPPQVKRVICFGKEAEQLQTFCALQKIEGYAFASLEPAVACAIEHAKPEEIILLSPAGSSYDLYADYTERGRHFKKLVADYIKD